MHIDLYEFGRIVINGRMYTTDIIVLHDRIQTNWWRQKGHELHMEDLKSIMDEEPQVLIVGTGFYGALKVLSETQEELQANQVELIVKKTSEACKVFNSLIKSGRKIVAAFHLTC